MKKRKFSIFQVYDYKGGKLKTSVNLNESAFYSELAELFEGIDLDIENSSIEEIVNILKDAEKQKDFYSTYAGSDGGFCGEIYEHVSGNLVGVSVSDFFHEIATYIKQNWV
jgi:hypothetical protein